MAPISQQLTKKLASPRPIPIRSCLNLVLSDFFVGRPLLLFMLLTLNTHSTRGRWIGSIGCAGTTRWESCPIPRRAIQLSGVIRLLSLYLPLVLQPFLPLSLVSPPVFLPPSAWKWKNFPDSCILLVYERNSFRPYYCVFLSVNLVFFKTVKYMVETEQKQKFVIEQ